MGSPLAAVFTELKVPAAIIPQCEATLTAVIFLSLIGTSESRLSQAEQSSIRQMWSEQDIPGILGLIQSKYTEDEWPGYFMGIMEPIVQDYLKDVL